MKKLILILTATVSLLAFPAFGQISVTGVNSIIGSASGSFVDVQLSLSIVGTNSISDATAVNILLKTFAAGAGLNGGGLFSITNITPTSPYTAANFSATPNSTFGTVGDAANNTPPSTVSDPTKDLGSNAPAGSSPVAGTGTTIIPFETIRFTSLSALTAGNIYNFSVTLGGRFDAQGSWVTNPSDTTFDINSAPTFTISVVPEPGTLSLLGLGGLGSLGLSLLRRRRVNG